MRISAFAGMLIWFAATAAGQAEIRGAWVSRFVWTSETPSTAQANIRSALDGMVTGHFNTCFMQLRGQCDTLYPSPYEPWSPLISSPDASNPGWDPAQYSVSQAHSRGLKIHAYFNTHVIWQGATAPSSTYYPNHIYYLHGNPTDPAHRDWVLYDDAGAPAAFSEYTWMNPGIPDADAYVRKQAIYLISTYDFDGLHFDRCRMSETGYGKNPIAVARWDNAATPGTPNDGPGNPDHLGWDDFMRDCVTRSIMNICGECWSVKRLMPLSSAPLGLWDASAYPGYSTGYYYGYGRGQDAKAWMTMGAQDFIVPQIYWDNPDPAPNFNEIMDDWLTAANAAGRYLVPGSNMSNGVAEVEAHALYARNEGCAGHNIWHSGNASFPTWSAAGHVYASAAPATPTYPWRDTEGVIVGRVYQDSAKTTPIPDAWVNSNGTTWTALSSGDGFYCFLRVSPGTYSMTATHSAIGTLTRSSIVVNAGEATTVDFYPDPVPPPDAPSNLVATPGVTTVDLTWTDNSSDETGFEVRRATATGGPYTTVHTAAADTTAYTDTPPASGTYYYVVRAVNNGGASAHSNEAYATIEGIDRIPTQKINASSNAECKTYSWFANDSSVRGLTLNRTTGHLLVAKSGTGGTSARILDTDLNEVGSPGLSVTGITVGTRALQKICAADDGVLYACNLVISTDSSLFRIYRWEDESAAPTAVTIDWTSTGGSEPALRKGDDMDLIGTGASTKILISGSTNTDRVFVFSATNSDGTAFAASQVFPGTGFSDDIGQNIRWEPDGTAFWWRYSGGANLYKFSASTGAQLGAWTAPSNGNQPAFDIKPVPDIPGSYFFISAAGNFGGQDPISPCRILSGTNTVGEPMFNLLHTAAGLRTGTCSANADTTTGNGEVILDRSPNIVYILYPFNAITKFENLVGCPVSVSRFGVE